MLIMDQRTMQIKYRIPASEIIRLSLSPYFDDIAVFHVKAVSYKYSLSFIYVYTNRLIKHNLLDFEDYFYIMFLGESDP